MKMLWIFGLSAALVFVAYQRMFVVENDLGAAGAAEVSYAKSLKPVVPAVNGTQAASRQAEAANDAEKYVQLHHTRYEFVPEQDSSGNVR